MTTTSTGMLFLLPRNGLRELFKADFPPKKKYKRRVENRGAVATPHSSPQAGSTYGRRLFQTPHSALPLCTEFFPSEPNWNEENLSMSRQPSDVDARNKHQTRAFGFDESKSSAIAFSRQIKSVSPVSLSVAAPMSTQFNVESQSSKEPLFLPSSDVSDDDGSMDDDHVNEQNNQTPAFISDDNTMRLQAWQDALLSYIAMPTHQLKSEQDEICTLLQEMMTYSDFSRLCLWIPREVQVTTASGEVEMGIAMKNKGQLLRMLARRSRGEVGRMVKRLLGIWGTSQTDLMIGQHSHYTPSLERLSAVL
ncbi:hypothetical protein B0H13DRAFT_1895261 [Mycena leptocephala]|nr:hypothetical protein B0H13DRAFT_1895261 [Mycena leptocephala]